jgi:two-component system chemotaxis response regulator CheB
MKKTRVLIVDDSAVVRNVLIGLFSLDESIEVVGEAVDPYDARDKIKQLKPDVLTLDIEMPKMDGITFLRNLMKLNPMPVVMLSTLTHEGADVTLQALEIGAIDFIAKPVITAGDDELETFQRELVRKVKTAAQTAWKLKFRRSAQITTAGATPPLLIANPEDNSKSVIAIGASTGGTEALRELLSSLPENFAPIVVTQHIPASFSERFARRLNAQTKLTVVETKEGDILQQNHVYITPGSHHLVLKKHGDQIICHLDDSALVNRHKPSVEVMFNSILDIFPFKVTAVLLTGMGEDGAKSMKKLAQAGAHTIVQDEASSLVWGMPGAAVKYGAANEIVPLNKIANRLVQHLSS